MYIYIYICIYIHIYIYIYIYIFISFDKWLFKKQYWSGTLLSCIEHSSGVYFY